VDDKRESILSVTQATPPTVGGGGIKKRLKLFKFFKKGRLFYANYNIKYNKKLSITRSGNSLNHVRKIYEYNFKVEVEILEKLI